MKPSPKSDVDQDFESFNTLLQVMRDDQLINEKITTLLKMDSYQRRYILNYWLEQLRKQNALENLQQALSCLFDDNVSAKVLKIISHHQIKKGVPS
jgi:hypothetical protein